MLRYDCKACGENIYEVKDEEHLGVLPVTLTCNGCGTKYTSGIVKGKLKTYKGTKIPKPRKPRKAKVVEPTTAPEPEIITSSNTEEH